MEKQAALDLLEFIHESPTNFHAVLSIKQRLQAHGFKQLFSGEAWHIEHGGKYFVTKNHSSLYAFIPGNGNLAEEGFKLICAHSDFPDQTPCRNAGGREIPETEHRSLRRPDHVYLVRPASVYGRTGHGQE